MQLGVGISFFLGLVLLIGGAEALVRGASRLAAAAGVSPLAIGLTVVAFGTSAPEMVVSAGAALSGASGADIAVGNVVGSNIFNVLVILGLSAAFAPLVVEQKLVRIDVPLLIALSLGVLLLARDGSISRVEGVVLFAGILAYTGFAIVQGRREGEAVRAEYAAEFDRAARGLSGVAGQLLLVVAGLGALVVGARLLVAGAIALARLLGVSELVISLTIIAGSTSLPELATSVVASFRGERDIAVGNVVGSSIFNLLAVLGLAAALAPNGLSVSPAALGFDLPVMAAVAVACLPIFFTGRRVSTGEGFLFLGYYVAYAGYLVLRAAEHDRLPLVSSVMLFFVLPITAASLLITVIREIRARRRGRAEP